MNKSKELGGNRDDARNKNKTLNDTVIYILRIRENPITEHEQDAILKEYSENKVELLEIKYVIADVKI